MDAPLLLTQPETMQTTWPVIWSRSLRSGADLARQNALAAARVVAERRAEQAELSLFLAGVHEGFGDPPAGG